MAYGVGVAYHISSRNFYSQVTQSRHILSINIVVVQSQTVWGGQRLRSQSCTCSSKLVSEPDPLQGRRKGLSMCLHLSYPHRMQLCMDIIPISCNTMCTITTD